MTLLYQLEKCTELVLKASALCLLLIRFKIRMKIDTTNERQTV